MPVAAAPVGGLPEEDKKPDFYVNALIPDLRDVGGQKIKGRWIRVGLGWQKTDKDGQVFYSIVMNTIPVGIWNGIMTMHAAPTDEDKLVAAKELIAASKK